jgi:hypothetical protein
VDALLPTRCATLAQVFPVMLRVPQVAKEHAARHADGRAARAAAARVRRRSASCSRASRPRPTVVVIDDLQWADDDGLRALAEILRAPGRSAAAPPRHGADRVGEDAASATPARGRPGEPRVIDLASLGPDEARALAVAFLERSDTSDADPELIASEAAGTRSSSRSSARARGARRLRRATT